MVNVLISFNNNVNTNSEFVDALIRDGETGFTVDTSSINITGASGDMSQFSFFDSINYGSGVTIDSEGILITSGSNQPGSSIRLRQLI